MSKLHINDVYLDFVHQYKYFGVILDSHLTFNKHLQNIIKITAFEINLLAKTIYKSMILPYFDYGDILFTNSTKKLLDKKDRLQLKAVKICLRLDGNAPDNILLHSAGVAKLSKRRDAHLLNYMYKKKKMY